MSDDAVIAKVRRHFVPVALNLYDIRADKGPGGDFFRAVQKQRPEQYQGVFLAAADGTVLAAHGRMVEPAKKWTAEVLDALDAALAKSRRLPDRDETPTTAPGGVGVGRSDGGLILAAYTRPMVLGHDPRGFGAVAFDRIPLSAADVGTLELAADLPPGTAWKLPKETVTKFHRLLAPASDANTLPRPDEVTDAEMQVRVTGVSGGVAHLALEGRVASVHLWAFEPHKGKPVRASVRLTGAAAVDVKTGRLIRLTVVGDGRFRNHAPFDKEETAYGAVAEWRRE